MWKGKQDVKELIQLDKRRALLTIVKDAGTRQRDVEVAHGFSRRAKSYVGDVSHAKTEWLVQEAKSNAE